MNIQNVTHTLRLREYYYMFLRHKLLFALTVFTAVVCSTVIAFALPRYYRAETVLLVEGGSILDPLISGLAISPSMAQRMRTMKDELLSWQRLTLLVEKLHLDKDAKNPLEFERLIKNLRSSLDIKFRNAEIIAVTNENRTPQQAQEIVQALSDIIIEGNLTSQKVETKSAIRFINQQLEAYRTKLEKSEDELRKFREVYSTTLPIATRMNEQIVALKLELNSLLQENTDEHPRVVQTRALIAQLEKQRDDNMRQAQQEGVTIEQTEFAKLMTSVPRQEQQLAKLQRDYEVNERIYSTLSQRLETAKISETLEQSDKGAKFRILEPARLPLEPVKPKKTLIILAGIVMGVGLAFVLIYLIELSDTSVRSLDEARSLFEFPVFGSISPIDPEQLMIEQSIRREASV